MGFTTSLAMTEALDTPIKRLQPSGIELSRLALGTVKFGRNTGVKYPTAFELPSDEQLRDVLSCANELGIQTLDTAPAYGSSQQRLGALLPNRHDWTIISKVGEQFDGKSSHFDFSAAATRASIEQSLRDLRRDWLDIVLIHSDGRDEQIAKHEGVIDALLSAKDKGLVRAIGMSSKTIAGGLWAIQHLECAMVTLNPAHLEELPVFNAAAANGKGVLVKKALQSGHGTGDIDAAFKLAMQTPGAISTVIGTVNPEHLRNNVLAANRHL